MATVIKPQPVTSAKTLSTVTTIRILNASAPQIWKALTDRAAVSAWFGDLSATLREGMRDRLDFGDGDFFALRCTRLDPPNLVEYEWCFLGIGPKNTIRWHISPSDRGCLLTVVDNEPGRSREEGLSRRAGWIDFTYRLERYLHLGEHSRYDWRRDFDGSIEIPGQPDEAKSALFTRAGLAQWLPLAGGPLAIDADATQDSSKVSDVAWDTPLHVRFNAHSSAWLQPTDCEIALVPYNGATLLLVYHRGWEGVSLDESAQKEQRQSYCERWISALKSARRVVEEQGR